MARILAVGDNVVDCYPALGRMFPGGNCLNVSVFARRFGAETSYVGAVGRDAAGETIRAALAAEGVWTERLRSEAGDTAYCVIGHRAGERVFLSWDFGVSMFRPDACDVAYAKAFDAVHVGQSSGLDADLAALSEGLKLSYDFSTKRGESYLSSIVPNCFLASFSGSDLSGGDAERLLERAVAAGAEWVLVTRGAEGALLGHASGTFRVDAVPTEIVDTLGAGDTFIARVLVGLLNGEGSPDGMLRAAAAAAAATCRYHGAFGHGAPLRLRIPVAAGPDPVPGTAP